MISFLENLGYVMSGVHRTECNRCGGRGGSVPCRVAGCSRGVILVKSSSGAIVTRQCSQCSSGWVAVCDACKGRGWTSGNGTY